MEQHFRQYLGYAYDILSVCEYMNVCVCVFVCVKVFSMSPK